jgi:hypothetical protein
MIARAFLLIFEFDDTPIAVNTIDTAAVDIRHQALI